LPCREPATVYFCHRILPSMLSASLRLLVGSDVEKLGVCATNAPAGL
jgi:hypothetical protein